MTKNEHTKSFSRPSLSKGVENKTTLFMLPALNLSMDKTNYELLRYFGFVNCFIDHKQGLVKAQDALYLVFNPSRAALQDFSKFFDIYKTYPNFVDDYIVDQNLIVIVFRIKEKWRESYSAFRASRYSKMSREYAELFRRKDLATGKVYSGKPFFIIHKHEEYRTYLEKDLGVSIDKDAELLDPLDEREIFDYEPVRANREATTEVLTREG